MSAYLRKATENDMDLLYEWVNEPGVRKSAFSTKKISYEDHKEWFHNIMRKKNCIQYIYMYEDKPTGQVRIDILDDIAEVDYSVCVEKRGMGHGKRILLLLKQQIKKDALEVKHIVARVKPENIASKKAFLNTGYVEKYVELELTINKED